MKKIIKKVTSKLGYSVVKTNAKKKEENTPESFLDIKETEFWEIYERCKPYTMTSVERMYALYTGVDYVLKNNIQGAFVECGVWRGGSAMLIAKMLYNRKITDRKIYLYDTFEGMSEPSQNDVDLTGNTAAAMLKETTHIKETSVWCLADLQDVQQNMTSTNYAEDNIIYVKGKVEDTIPQTIPANEIALLRLDTDWYESTKHELNHLYPKLQPQGVLIIDDYGHWEGCRKAVDEYLLENKISILLQRIDYTGRIAIKW